MLIDLIIYNLKGLGIVGQVARGIGILDPAADLARKEMVDKIKGA